ncbi:uncharacterized protein LOC126419158 [Schistocerca serialis cubense]|uniref:uncharacterized protein LOC126419158 n=1 Tax=Schistocerca serialis cubense TaxID=2023355 RepID=UPI00214EC43E|nr:uncharacterized protein LOC126419158 [Schistocerca serialis cubense]
MTPAVAIAFAAALFSACAAASAAPVPAEAARLDSDLNGSSGKLVVLLPVDIVRTQLRLRPEANDNKIFYNSLGDFIESSSLFPIEINVPDVIRWFYGFMSSWFPSLANRWQQESTPRIRLYLLAPPPASDQTYPKKTTTTNTYKKLFISPQNKVVILKSSSDGSMQLIPFTIYREEIVQRVVMLAEIDMRSGSENRQPLQP